MTRKTNVAERECLATEREFTGVYGTYFPASQSLKSPERSVLDMVSTGQ
jgi:hypothetical protein